MIIKIKIKINQIFYLNYYMKVQHQHYFLLTVINVFLMLSMYFQVLIHIYLIPYKYILCKFNNKYKINIKYHNN